MTFTIKFLSVLFLKATLYCRRSCQSSINRGIQYPSHTIYFKQIIPPTFRHDKIHLGKPDQRNIRYGSHCTTSFIVFFEKIKSGTGQRNNPVFPQATIPIANIRSVKRSFKGLVKISYRLGICRTVIKEYWC